MKGELKRAPGKLLKEKYVGEKSDFNWKNSKKDYKKELDSIDIRLGTLGVEKKQNGIKQKELKERIDYYADSDVNKSYLKLQNIEKFLARKMKLLIRWK